MWNDQEFRKLPPLQWPATQNIMQYPHIARVRVVDDYRLLIEFSNQELKEYSFHNLLNRPMFEPLKNPAFFKSFRVEPGGYAVV